MALSQTVSELTALVEPELKDIVTSRDMRLYQMMSYHMGWNYEAGQDRAAPNKERTHGVLCLLACHAAGGDLGTALPAAAAVELVNNFCLIHDDVQGGIPKRDDRDAVWWVWGPAQAINAGDGMHALGRLALFRLLQRGVSPETTFRAVQLLDEASLQACEGRFLDLEAQERIDMGVQAYVTMVSGKSGALVACAMKLGALVATPDAVGDEAVLEALGSCGTKLGLAMQMRADSRELWGHGEAVSAPSPEVMNKKKLLPVVQALEKASIRDKRRLGDIYFKRVLGPEDVARLLEVIEELGAKEESERLIERTRAEALEALDTPAMPAQGRADIERFVASLLE